MNPKSSPIEDGRPRPLAREPQPKTSIRESRLSGGRDPSSRIRYLGAGHRAKRGSTKLVRRLSKSTRRAAEATACWLKKGVVAAANEFNAWTPNTKVVEDALDETEERDDAK